MTTNEFQSDNRSDLASRKKGARDADILVLLWDVFRARGNEIDHLLDLALCILSSASNFPERADLERTLQRARSLLRNFG
jgi:hypothetical protein